MEQRVMEWRGKESGYLGDRYKQIRDGKGFGEYPRLKKRRLKEFYEK